MPPDAKRRFELASEYYAEGRYSEALPILEALNGEYPNTRHILFPLARCYARLHQLQNALDICDVLIRDHDYDRAKEMKQQLLDTIAKQQQPQQPADGDAGDIGIPGVMTADDLLGPDPSAGGDGDDLGIGAVPKLDDTIGLAPIKPVETYEEEPSPWRERLTSTPVIVGGGVVALLVLVTVVLALTQGGTQPQAPGDAGQQTASGPQTPTRLTDEERADAAKGAAQALITRLVLLIIGFFVLAAGAMYLTLLLRDKLPDKPFPWDALHVAGFSTLTVLICFCCPCVGPFLAGYMLYAVYEMDLLDRILLLVAFLVVVYVPFNYFGEQLFNEQFGMSLLQDFETAMDTSAQGTIPAGDIFVDGHASDWWNVPEFWSPTELEETTRISSIKLAHTGDHLNVLVTLNAGVPQIVDDFAYGVSEFMGAYGNARPSDTGQETSAPIGYVFMAPLEGTVEREFEFNGRATPPPHTLNTLPPGHPGGPGVRCAISMGERFESGMTTLDRLNSWEHPEEVAYNETYIEMRYPISKLELDLQAPVKVWASDYGW